MGEFGFLQLDLRFGFFLGAFAFADLFAKAAGMFAVEGALDCFGEGTCLQIICKHRRPCDGLQDYPM